MNGGVDELCVCSGNSRKTDGSMLGIAAAVLLRHNTASAAAATAARQRGRGKRYSSLGSPTFTLICTCCCAVGMNHRSDSLAVPTSVERMDQEL